MGGLWTCLTTWDRRGSAATNRGSTSLPPPAAAKLAKALGVPLAYLWASDDRQAEIILGFAQLNTEQQDGLLGLLREFLGERDLDEGSEEDT